MKQLVLFFLFFTLAIQAEAQRRKQEKYRTRPVEMGEKYLTPHQAKLVQWRKKQTQNTKVYFTPEISSFYNINNGDLYQVDAGKNVLDPKSSMGLALGLGIRIENRFASSPFLAASVGFRFVAQRLDFKYESELVTERYNNNYLYFKIIGGFKFKLTASQALDLGIGFQNLQSIKGRNEDPHLSYTAYTDAATGEELRYLQSASIVHWGSTNGSLGLIFCPTAQLGYSIRGLLAKESYVRIALEFSTKVGNNQNPNYNNQTKYLEFDRNRNIIRTEKFNDRHTAIGLNLSVGI